MAKAKTIYFCQECGHESSKWMGQCPGCRQWNTFAEETVERPKHASSERPGSSARPVPLSEIEMKQEERFTSGFPELDRVLGGGIVPASIVLVGGDPGIGKSTLLLQVCKNLSIQNVPVLYISGEESLYQIKLRAQRIGSFTDSLSLLCETNLEVIDAVLRRAKPRVVIIDSIQTMFSDNISSSPGSEIGRAHV